ncbi:hypothetical protein HY772_04930 [Candidatus Woesearchaeota archaeon]|nr:hypothetical protein [Candidatus Woesearchaeota archaeon]
MAEEYPPFNISGIEYYIKRKLGVDGYFASAYLAESAGQSPERLVIKVIHPGLIFNTADEGRRLNFAQEAVILALLAKQGISDVVGLRGVAPICLEFLKTSTKSRSESDDLLKKCVGNPYRSKPSFIFDLFEGSPAGRGQIQSDLTRLEEKLGSDSKMEVPYLALEFVDPEHYKSLNQLILDKSGLAPKQGLEICRRFSALLYAIHELEIAYKDMKEGHIFWDAENKRMKVIDWNASTLAATQDDLDTDRFEFGRIMYHVFSGRLYTSPNDHENGSRLPKITLAALSAASQANDSIDFGSLSL